MATRAREREIDRLAQVLEGDVVGSAEAAVAAVQHAGLFMWGVERNGVRGRRSSEGGCVR